MSSYRMSSYLFFSIYGDQRVSTKESNFFSYSRNTTRPIQLNLAQFSTECNWDYLYIFDGTSIYDPLLASLRLDKTKIF